MTNPMPAVFFGHGNPMNALMQGAPASLETVIVTRVRDLVGGFKVRRALPSSRRRMVGPFIFLDQREGNVINHSRQAGC